MFRFTDKNEKSNNKSAFIMAGLIILLCLVALSGATFALFTSNANDGKIGVITTSGNVRVDIVDSESGASLINQVLIFENGGPSEGILFEPGAFFYTKGFKAKNIGDVKIKFRLYISDDPNLDMEKFAEAFDFYITTDPSDPTKRQDIVPFNKVLNPGEMSETYYLVIKMKESATKEFQGQIYSGIGITVCAVQGNVGTKEID